jgi:hypothetical protein
MAEAGNLFPSESMNTWLLDISFVKPSVSCALMAFTDSCAISVATTFFVRTLNLRLIRILPAHHAELDLALSSEAVFQIVLLHLMAPYFINISVVFSRGSASTVCPRPVIVSASSAASFRGSPA